MDLPASADRAVSKSTEAATMSEKRGGNGPIVYARNPKTLTWERVTFSRGDVMP